ncbi:hypothetical protein TcWFU_001696 [Taenia crassiceps]|uniref:Uncharacterized protein n=1 Tax=Taenia crassiceps TaxID=6207 RepID=A0ABR4QP95_9CEST
MGPKFSKGVQNCQVEKNVCANSVLPEKFLINDEEHKIGDRTLLLLRTLLKCVEASVGSTTMMSSPAANERVSLMCNPAPKTTADICPAAYPPTHSIEKGKLKTPGTIKREGERIVIPLPTT